MSASGIGIITLLLLTSLLIAGFDEVLVYHGIGTGKLAYAVKKFLDKHPKVKSYSDAHASLYIYQNANLIYVQNQM